jgi:hypothetical protein
MDRREAFDAWAPPDAPWSAWVKPVLFAHIDEDVMPSSLPKPSWLHDDLFALRADADYRTSARRRVAVVLDVPDVEGVAAGVALRDLGFQPVPLYTSLPGPGRDAVVPMERILAGLLAAALELRQRPVPRDAQPAFLLDARRSAEGVFPRPGVFDNRSVCFATDFPSAGRLREGGVEAIVLAQSGSFEPRIDLLRTLAQWQDEGLAIHIVRTDSGEAARPIRVATPGLLLALRLWWRRGTLRGDQERGFGAPVPPLRQSG